MKTTTQTEPCDLLLSPTPWSLKRGILDTRCLDLVDANGSIMAASIVKPYRGLGDGLVASAAPELLAVARAVIRVSDGKGVDQAILDMALEVVAKIEKEYFE